MSPNAAPSNGNASANGSEKLFQNSFFNDVEMLSPALSDSGSGSRRDRSAMHLMMESGTTGFPTGAPASAAAAGRQRTASISNENLNSAFGHSIFTWQLETPNSAMGTLPPPGDSISSGNSNASSGSSGSSSHHQQQPLSSVPFSPVIDGGNGGGYALPKQLGRARASTLSANSKISSPLTAAPITNSSPGTAYSAFGKIKDWIPEEGPVSGSPTLGGAVAFSTTIRVENVDPHVTHADMDLHFGRFGLITAMVLNPDEATAIITYKSSFDASEALKNMNGVKIGKYSLLIVAVRDAQSKFLQVTTPRGISHLEIYSLFTQYGAIASCVIDPSGTGFVQFFSIEDAIEARSALNGSVQAEKRVTVNFSDSTEYARAEEAVKRAALLMAAASSSPSMTSQQQQEITPPKKRVVNLLKISTPSHHPQQQQQHVISTPVSQFFSKQEFEIRPNSAPIGKSYPSFGVSPAITRISSPTVDPSTPLHSEKNYTNVEYNEKIPALILDVRVDSTLVREYRKKLDKEVTLSHREFEVIFAEVLSKATHYSVDLNGNVLVQKVVERCDEASLFRLVDKLSADFAAIAVNKSGTYVVQKIIEVAKTDALFTLITKALKPYTSELLMDTFGNYVVQGVLKLGAPRNQFILEALKANCLQIALSRFGSRAMRTCLESNHVLKSQQKQIAVTIVQNAVVLAQSPNGAIVLTWLCDSSNLPSRYKVLSSKFKPHMIDLALSKQASVFLGKIYGQKIEPAAKAELLETLFEEPNLTVILKDKETGLGMIYKLICNFGPNEKPFYARLQDKIAGWTDPAYDDLKLGVDFAAMKVVNSPAIPRTPLGSPGIFASKNAASYAEEGKDVSSPHCYYGKLFSPMPSDQKDWRK